MTNIRTSHYYPLSLTAFIHPASPASHLYESKIELLPPAPAPAVTPSSLSFHADTFREFFCA